MIRTSAVVSTGGGRIILTAGVLGFLFLLELFPQSFDFVSERLLICAESLNHIEQVVDRTLCPFRQRLLSLQLLDLLDNRFYV